MNENWDFIIIGSGFGGSVSALRLAEKGYKVCVLERGKRYSPNDFAKTNWQIWKWLWIPQIFCTGIQRLTLLKNSLVLSGSGVGGGSLGYCAVLLEPPDPFFNDKQWAGLDKSWKESLAPFYQTARKMLGVAKNPKLLQSDDLLLEYARDIGREQHFQPTEVGIYFGDENCENPDPYFDGKGPVRTGCDFNGACMVGCRNGGKNSLDKNYLYLAEQLGVKIFPQRTVCSITELDEGGYIVKSTSSTNPFSKKWELRTKGVIVSAGTLGTNNLLLKCKQRNSLKNLSTTLGKKVRTNSEVLLGITSKNKDADFSKGISITSSLFVDEQTHIEPVRYPKGSDAMFWLSALLTDGGTWLTRPLKYFWTCIKHPFLFLKNAIPFGWAQRSIILLVMQTLDNQMELFLKRRWYFPFKFGMGSKRPTSTVPTYIPQANDAGRAIAKKINGVPKSAITEVLFNAPITAHIIGGCAIGKDKSSGVVDKYCKAFGQENLYIIDGSIIPANMGVNPSLTITALAEHAMGHIPEKQE